MSPLPTIPRGMFFEEYEVGQHILTSSRTVTEGDIVSFAGLTGDYNQIHTDAEFARRTPFGQRIAHGLLGLSIALGLATQTGVLEGTVLAFREIQNWKFVKPVYIGDTIHAELDVTEVKALPRIKGGSVVLEVMVLNQRDETLMKGAWNALIVSRDAVSRTQGDG